MNLMSDHLKFPPGTDILSDNAISAKHHHAVSLISNVSYLIISDALPTANQLTSL